MAESTFHRILTSIVFLVAASKCRNLSAETLFPAGEALLGGSSWQRRLSPEFRIGTQGDLAAAGGTLRAYWGPYAGFEVDYERVLESAADPHDFFAFRLPVRVAMGPEDFFAPYFAYHVGESGRQKIKSTLLGIQFHGAFLGLGYWLQAGFSLSTRKENFDGFFQVDKSFRISKNALSFIGLRAGERYNQGTAETGIFFVSGSRF